MLLHDKIRYLQLWISDIAYSKAKALQEGGCVYMEFGTRRRRTLHAQDIMVGALVRASTEMQSGGRLMGTSNVRLLEPVGLIALVDHMHAAGSFRAQIQCGADGNNCTVCLFSARRSLLRLTLTCSEWFMGVGLCLVL